GGPDGPGSLFDGVADRGASRQAEGHRDDPRRVYDRRAPGVGGGRAARDPHQGGGPLDPQGGRADPRLRTLDVRFLISSALLSRERRRKWGLESPHKPSVSQSSRSKTRGGAPTL